MVSKKRVRLKYDQYTFCVKEKILYGIEMIFVISLINYLCYKTWWCYVSVIPVSFYYFNYKKKIKIRERKNKLKIQFLDVLHGLQSAIQTGYSVEQSIVECEKELRRIYGNQQEWIDELEYMRSQLEIGTAVEKLWVDLGNRMCIEEVNEFADIMVVCKRSGGNLTNVMKKCECILGDKLRTEQEIAVTIAGKKFEQTIMSIIPVGIIVYMQSASENFVSVLYHNMFGAVVMTICLSIYLISFAMGRKLVKISV